MEENSLGGEDRWKVDRAGSHKPATETLQGIDNWLKPIICCGPQTSFPCASNMLGPEPGHGPGTFVEKKGTYTIPERIRPEERMHRSRSVKKSANTIHDPGQTAAPGPSNFGHRISRVQSQLMTDRLVTEALSKPTGAWRNAESAGLWFVEGYRTDKTVYAFPNWETDVLVRDCTSAGLLALSMGDAEYNRLQPGTIDINQPCRMLAISNCSNIQVLCAASAEEIHVVNSEDVALIIGSDAPKICVSTSKRVKLLCSSAQNTIPIIECRNSESITCQCACTRPGLDSPSEVMHAPKFNPKEIDSDNSSAYMKTASYVEYSTPTREQQLSSRLPSYSSGLQQDSAPSSAHNLYPLREGWVPVTAPRHSMSTASSRCTPPPYIAPSTQAQDSNFQQASTRSSTNDAAAAAAAAARAAVAAAPAQQSAPQHQPGAAAPLLSAAHAEPLCVSLPPPPLPRVAARFSAQGVTREGADFLTDFITSLRSVEQSNLAVAAAHSEITQELRRLRGAPPWSCATPSEAQHSFDRCARTRHALCGASPSSAPSRFMEPEDSGGADERLVVEGTSNRLFNGVLVEAESSSKQGRPAEGSSFGLVVVREDFRATRSDEMSVTRGDTLVVYGLTDDAACLKVKLEQFDSLLGHLGQHVQRKEGCVPTSCIQAGHSCKVEAAFDYLAQSKDELSFTRGEILALVSYGEDAGWFVGFNGRYGLVPDNYVLHAKEAIASLPPILPPRPSQTCLLLP